MSALDLLLVAAVVVGISVQAAIGFGFAFFVAPAAFAAFHPEQAVTLVLLLAIAINCLVLFGEGRRVDVANGTVAVLVAAAVPGMVIGAWVVTEANRELLQLLVGVVVLAGAGVQALGPRPAATGRASALEIGGGLAAGALTTSVSVNGPAVVLVLTRLGLRGGRLRDSLAAALLGLSLLAAPVVLIASGADRALPDGWVVLACVPALLVGHRAGAAVFRRLDDEAHHRVALGAAALAGLLSIGAALVG
ncbi:MAG: uncharacterized protein QOI10_2323 [Solirubrobacterales bacterium]|nr:uncharacterized protein [Solirubrobacterales bacterium]